MEHLFSIWDCIEESITQSEQILLLSDFDGTLTPIAERPDLAGLTENTYRILKSLADLPQITLGIISGRALADLKNRVDIPGTVYAGNHGLEIEGPGLRYIDPAAEETRPVLGELMPALSLSLSHIDGVLIEDKGFSLSVHYRQVEEDKEGEVRDTVERLLKDYLADGKVNLTPGKKVCEIRPATAWNKGQAVRLIIEKYRSIKCGNGYLQVYLGDDATDEDAFHIIQKCDRGVAVLVGRTDEESVAGYYVNSPDEVFLFLDKMMDCISEAGGVSG